jgi:glycosyltransferase involved in cell wall biosynthesis
MKVVIAGGISDSRQYYEQVRQVAGGDPRFVFTGYVQDKELEELYSNAAFYVLPSDLEGMPLSLLEAMSYGRCCLTSDIPECAEVMGDFGITFKHGDTESLRTHLEQLIADSDLCARLGSAARQHVSVANNWDRIVQQTLGVYVGKASL